MIHRLRLRGVPALAALLGVVAFARGARGAPPWVERRLTLPAGQWAFDVGLGVGHTDAAPQPPALPLEDTAAGVNGEISVGITNRVELGLRSGIRFGSDLDRAVRADQYGRLFDRQTFATGADTAANPEVRVRAALVEHRVIELAVEGRLVLPFEADTNAGVLFGVPFAFHLGGRARLDVGIFVPVVLSRPTADAAIDLPVDFWFQASRRVWLGPMTGVVFEHAIGDVSPGGARTDVSLGFGLGYAVTHYLDFKAMVLFPSLNQDTRIFGFGAGVEVRIE